MKWSRAGKRALRGAQAGLIAVAWACVTSSGCEQDCGAGSVACGFDCVNVEHDLLNCGACGHRCQELELCVAAQCVCHGPGRAQCDGACTDTDYDESNCGGCGVSCGGETPFCVEAECRECPLERCGDECVDFDRDRHNCGACGISCGPDGACIRGHCARSDSSACEPACDLDIGEICCESADGAACSDVAWDDANCGECGRRCICGEGECDDY